MWVECKISPGLQNIFNTYREKLNEQTDTTDHTLEGEGADTDRDT